MYRLRELCQDDLVEINKWRNDSELISHLGAPFRFINLDVDHNWYNNYIQSRGSTIRCAIVDETNKGSMLGLVSLTGIDFLNQTAEFHIMIGEASSRGKGVGTFATIEMLQHAFNDMNLNRIELSVLECNTSALGLYEKVGFKREGTKRKSIFKKGKFVDIVIMSVLKEEFFVESIRRKRENI